MRSAVSIRSNKRADSFRQRRHKVNLKFGGNNRYQFWVEPGADKKWTTIYWGEHMFDENMVGHNTHWTDPMPSSVPGVEEFGIKDDPDIAPPGAYAGVNREWKGHKPSKVTGGYYGSGMAIRDTWGPDAEYIPFGSQAKPEVYLDRVSVDYFLDEFSVPCNKENTVMKSCETKHTTNLRVNIPQFDNQLDTSTLRTLHKQLSQSTTSVDKRITMIGACQNGKSEWWCKGSPTAELAKSLRWLVHPPPPPTQNMDSDRSDQVKRIAEILTTQRQTPNPDVEREEVAVHGSLQGNPDDGGESVRILHAANKQARWLETQERAISTSSKLATPKAVEAVAENLRWGLRTVSTLSAGGSPTLSFVNGKAHNIGAGIAVLCNFAALRNEAELTYSGAAAGTTPIGGLLRLLTDPACDLKYPGLAEYITLTGDMLCYGDARRLGWTAVYAPTDIQLNERMVHDYMNMHGPGQDRYSKRILDNLLFNDNDINPDQDRCSISAAKANWIREAFEGKESMTSIIEALTDMSLDSSSNSEEEIDIVKTTSMPTDNTDETTHAVGTVVVTRQQWATYVLQLLNTYSPMALSVTLAMVRKARAERLSLEGCLSLEFRCQMRMVARSDFIVSQV